MFQDAFSIMGMLEYGIGNAFSFSVLPDRRNGCFSEYGNASENSTVLASPDRQNGCLFQYWNAKIQIAKMDARTQMLEYGTRIENAAAWRCYVHKINPKFHNF
jgi:hypothetical protein